LQTPTAQIVDWCDDKSGKTWQIIEVGDWEAATCCDSGDIIARDMAAGVDVVIEEEGPVRKRIAPNDR
jgi:predicted 3-demethylubiquinone-9 3-methyltransferase (glyoxalase superfamily)